jgi:hypothetical protein
MEIIVIFSPVILEVSDTCWCRCTIPFLLCLSSHRCHMYTKGNWLCLAIPHARVCSCRCSFWIQRVKFSSCHVKSFWRLIVKIKYEVNSRGEYIKST